MSYRCKECNSLVQHNTPLMLNIQYRTVENMVCPKCGMCEPVSNNRYCVQHREDKRIVVRQEIEKETPVCSECFEKEGEKNG